MIGRTIENTLEESVTDIVTASLVNLLSDLDADRIDHFISVGMHDYTPTADALDKEVLSVVNECLELVKAHVSQQRWKSHLMDKESSIPATDPSDESELKANSDPR